VAVNGIKNRREDEANRPGEQVRPDPPQGCPQKTVAFDASAGSFTAVQGRGAGACRFSLDITQV